LAAAFGVQLVIDPREILLGSSVIMGYRPKGRVRECLMKRRLLAIAAALMFCASPWILAQDQGTTPPDQNAAATQNDQVTTPPVIRQKDDSKIKQDGGKSDVDAIGNRKMGGRGMGNWYSLESEIRMGKEYAQQVEASVKLIQDPVVTEYVNRIGQNLVRNS